MPMKRKSRRTIRRKKSKTMPLQPQLVPPARGKQERKPGRMHWIWVLALVLLAAEAAYLLWKDNASGSVPCQVVWKVQGARSPSGAFSAWDVRSASGNVVVSDQLNHQLVVFDESGNFLRRIGNGKGASPEQFQEPSSLAAVDKDEIAVIDTWNAAVKIFRLGGPLAQVIELGKRQPFYGPRGLDYDGKVFWVVDTGRHRIVQMDRQGNIIKVFGKQEPGAGEDAFFNPVAVAVDETGRFCVADSDNRRVQCFDASGRYARTLKFSGRPIDVAFSSGGRLYVAVEGGPVEVFDAKYHKKGSLVDGGSGNAFLGIRSIEALHDEHLLLAGQDQVWMVRLRKES